MKLDYLKKRFHPERAVKFCRFKAEEAFDPKKGLTGYDLVAELAKVADARLALDSIERGIHALLLEAEGDHPLAYGVVGKGGVLEVFRLRDWTTASALRIIRSAYQRSGSVPLYSEDEVDAWLNTPPAAWGFKRAIGPDTHASYNHANHLEYIGWPVPLFNDEQIAAWKAGTLDRDTAKPRTAPEFDE